MTAEPHAHGHSHAHGHEARTRPLAWTLALVVGYAAAEVIGGLVSGSLALPSRRTTMTLTVRRPAIQPDANAGPAVRALGAPRTTTTATIGIGLRATAMAEGSRSPMASFSTAAHSLRRRAPFAVRDETTAEAGTEA